MHEKVIIIGNSLAAEIIHAILKQDPHIDVVAFAVNKEFIKQSEWLGKPVLALETLASTHNPSDYKVVQAIGYSNLNRTRETTFNHVKALSYRHLTYIHPSATVFAREVGEGVFVMPNATIEPHVTIKANTVVWSNVVLAHHAIVQENCWVAAGSVVSGEASLGKNTFLGVNTTVINKVAIGNYNIIGAGALISKNTADYDVMLARSAEKHRFNSEDYCKYYRF